MGGGGAKMFTVYNLNLYWCWTTAVIFIYHSCWWPP